MFDWKILLTVAGVNLSSLFGFVWWLRGWLADTRTNTKDIEALQEKVESIEINQQTISDTMRDQKHDIELLQRDMLHRFEMIDANQKSMMLLLSEKAEDDRQYRKEQEGNRERTMVTLQKIGSQMESQCNLVTQALKSAIKN